MRGVDRLGFPELCKTQALVLDLSASIEMYVLYGRCAALPDQVIKMTVHTYKNAILKIEKCFELNTIYNLHQRALTIRPDVSPPLTPSTR